MPAKYHTVIDLPRKRAGSKRSPLGWKSLFSKAGRHGSLNNRKSHSPSNSPGTEARKASVPSELVFGNVSMQCIFLIYLWNVPVCVWNVLVNVNVLCVNEFLFNLLEFLWNVLQKSEKCFSV